MSVLKRDPIWVFVKLIKSLRRPKIGAHYGVPPVAKGFSTHA
jgi:hypothetical protein